MWDCVVPSSLKTRAAIADITSRGTDEVLTAILEVARLADIPVLTHGCTALLPYVGAYMDALYALPHEGVDTCATVPVRELLARMLEAYPGLAAVIVLARTSDVLDGLCLPVKACAPTPTLLFDHLELCSGAAVSDDVDTHDARTRLLHTEFEQYAWMFVCACVHTGHRKLSPFCLAVPWAEQSVPCNI